MLVTRADRAPTPAQARDLRAEAADLLETRLNEAGPRARSLREDLRRGPGPREGDRRARPASTPRLEDWAGLAKILERRAEALRGEAKVEAICKLAELYEDQLNNLPEATRRYEAALELDPQSLTALKGLDRIYNRTGRGRSIRGHDANGDARSRRRSRAAARTRTAAGRTAQSPGMRPCVRVRIAARGQRGDLLAKPVGDTGVVRRDSDSDGDEDCPDQPGQDPPASIRPNFSVHHSPPLHNLRRDCEASMNATARALV